MMGLLFLMSFSFTALQVVDDEKRSVLTVQVSISGSKMSTSAIAVENLEVELETKTGCSKNQSMHVGSRGKEK